MTLSQNWQNLQKSLPKQGPKRKHDKHKVAKPVHVPKPNTKIANESTILETILWVKDDIDLKNQNTRKIDANDVRMKQPGKYLAIDCEFVGVGPGGEESALARVSIVNFYGYTIYDEFVKPRETVTDWRTWVSGVSPKHMSRAISFQQAQADTAKLLKDRILVGHAVHHDLEALFLTHSKALIRDTTKLGKFRAVSGGKTPGLKKLCQHFLDIDIQQGQHSSVEDARATMLLFRMFKKDFDKGTNPKPKLSI